MALIEARLGDGVRRITYDAAARTATVYYASGAIDYVYGGVSWSDFAAVVASPYPALAAQTSLVTKYRSSSGHR